MCCHGNLTYTAFPEASEKRVDTWELSRAGVYLSQAEVSENVSWEVCVCSRFKNGISRTPTQLWRKEKNERKVAQKLHGIQNSWSYLIYCNLMTINESIKIIINQQRKYRKNSHKDDL